MSIWPIILDSDPACLGGRPLLHVPLGTNTLLAHLKTWLKPISPKAPIVLSCAAVGAEYREKVQEAWPGARVASNLREFEQATARCELSDALLIIDPRCLPVDEGEISALVQQHAAEPSVAHQLVAFETGVFGTKEHVSVDSRGHVRGVLRYYQPVTWPFLDGVAATMLPFASGVVGPELIPTSLVELRQTLASRGIPSRDMPIQGGAMDLSDEPGLLAANEQFVFKTANAGADGRAASVPHRVGGGQLIHPTVRTIGPVIIHAAARVDEHVTLVGPTLIGPGAHIGAGAMVAHAVIGAGCTVPGDAVVRDRLWFTEQDGRPAGRPAHRPASYRDRLARLTVEPREEVATSHSLRVWHMRTKRALDVTAAALTLALMSPLLLLVAIAVWLESKRPIFYAQKREGAQGRVFRCWKFRTMMPGAENVQLELQALDHTDGPHFKAKSDPRVTRVGRVLRATNLDELPQLFNVLCGDMSLVGPRPSPFRENQLCVPWREARLSVRPGITGMWQVCRHDRSDGDFHQWIEYDILYVRHFSFWLDLKILIATVVTLGGKKHVSASWLVRSDDRTRPIEALHPSVATDRAVTT